MDRYIGGGHATCYAPAGRPWLPGSGGQTPCGWENTQVGNMFHYGPFIHLDTPPEVEFAKVEHLREEWMQLCMESGLAAKMGKVMQEAPWCPSLTLLPKQHQQCTLVGHDMAHWPAMVRSWGVLVSPRRRIIPPGIYAWHMPGICHSYARHMPGICLMNIEGKNTP